MVQMSMLRSVWADLFISPKTLCSYGTEVHRIVGHSTGAPRGPTCVAMSTACEFAACRGIFVPATGTSRGRASRRRTRVFSSPADPGSSSPWWASLPAVHVLVFHPESDDEALYTVSRRDGDFAANDFVAFQSLRDATRASVVVSDLCGEMPVVDTVDVRVVVFLAEQCGYGVDVVPTGTAFEPPGVLIDETKNNKSQDDNKHNTNEPRSAISTADLKRYLADGGDFAASTSSSREGEENSDAVSSSSETETIETHHARVRAAAVMRSALATPVRRIRGAVREVTTSPAHAMMTPMRQIIRSVRFASGVPTGTENLDPSWGEETPMPLAAQAVYRALIVLAEQRIHEQ